MKNLAAATADAAEDAAADAAADINISLWQGDESCKWLWQ